MTRDLHSTEAGEASPSFWLGHDGELESADDYPYWLLEDDAEEIDYERP